MISIGRRPAREADLRGQGGGRAKCLNCQAFSRGRGIVPIRLLVKLGGLRARRFAQAREYVAPVFTGTVRLIGRLTLDIAWFVISAAIHLFGRYMRFALTIAFLVSLVAVGVEFFHHWPSPRIAVGGAIASIASLGLRGVLYRLERRAYDYPPLWR